MVKHLVSLGVFGALLSASGFAQVMSNGSFENAKVNENSWVGGIEADGWYFNAGSGIGRGDSAWGRAGHSGAQYAYLQCSGNGIGMVSQTVSGFTIGQRYRVSFWLARRNTSVKLIQAANVAVPVELLADNQVIFPFTFAAGKGEWRLYQSRTFVARTKGITFTFVGKTSWSDRATLIDDVVVTPVRLGER